MDALFGELAAGFGKNLTILLRRPLTRYRERYKDNPSLVISEPLLGLSGQYVLAMCYIDGTPLRELEHADDTIHQQVAVALADWITQELFTHK